MSAGNEDSKESSLSRPFWHPSLAFLLGILEMLSFDVQRIYCWTKKNPKEIYAKVVELGLPIKWFTRGMAILQLSSVVKFCVPVWSDDPRTSWQNSCHCHFLAKEGSATQRGQTGLLSEYMHMSYVKVFVMCKYMYTYTVYIHMIYNNIYIYTLDI